MRSPFTRFPLLPSSHHDQKGQSSLPFNPSGWRRLYSCSSSKYYSGRYILKAFDAMSCQSSFPGYFHGLFQFQFENDILYVGFTFIKFLLFHVYIDTFPLKNNILRAVDTISHFQERNLLELDWNRNDWNLFHFPFGGRLYLPPII